MNNLSIDSIIHHILKGQKQVDDKGPHKPFEDHVLNSSCFNSENCGPNLGIYTMEQFAKHIRNTLNDTSTLSYKATNNRYFFYNERTNTIIIQNNNPPFKCTCYRGRITKNGKKIKYNEFHRLINYEVPRLNSCFEKEKQKIKTGGFYVMHPHEKEKAQEKTKQTFRTNANDSLKNKRTKDIKLKKAKAIQAEILKQKKKNKEYLKNKEVGSKGYNDTKKKFEAYDKETKKVEKTAKELLKERLMERQSKKNLSKENEKTPSSDSKSIKDKLRERQLEKEEKKSKERQKDTEKIIEKDKKQSIKDRLLELQKQREELAKKKEERSKSHDR